MYLTPPAIDIRWGRFSLQTLPPSTHRPGVFVEERMCGEPSLSDTCSSLKTKRLKLLHHLERSRGRPEDFSDFVDQSRMSVSHESRALANVHESSASNPINRAHIASAATGSSASTIFPIGRGVP